jgi:hypothetical protein
MLAVDVGMRCPRYLASSRTCFSQLAVISELLIRAWACVTGEWKSCYVSFHECVRTSKIYVRDCTPVPPLAMLLFCTSYCSSSP